MGKLGRASEPDQGGRNEAQKKRRGSAAKMRRTDRDARRAAAVTGSPGHLYRRIPRAKQRGVRQTVLNQNNSFTNWCKIGPILTVPQSTKRQDMYTNWRDLNL